MPRATKFVGVGPAKLEAVMDTVSNLKGVTLKAEDMADAALFLAVDEARYGSGHNLFFDPFQVWPHFSARAGDL